MRTFFGLDGQIWLNFYQNAFAMFGRVCGAPCDQRRKNGSGCRFGSFAVKELFSGNVFSGILCSSVEYPVVVASIIVLDDLGFTYKYQG